MSLGLWRSSLCAVVCYGGGDGGGSGVRAKNNQFPKTRKLVEPFTGTMRSRETLHKILCSTWNALTRRPSSWRYSCWDDRDCTGRIVKFNSGLGDFDDKLCKFSRAGFNRIPKRYFRSNLEAFRFFMLFWKWLNVWFQTLYVLFSPRSTWKGYVCGKL